MVQCCKPDRVSWWIWWKSMDMGDMSRVFSIGKLPKAYAAHQTCLEIQEAVTEKAKPGAVLRRSL